MSKEMNFRYVVVPRTLCFVFHENDVLLIKRSPFRRLFPNKINGLGGHVEQDEDVYGAVVREIKEGRGSPHGGVFLDIAWIKEKIAKSEEHIKRKLPSMYHQFKALADIDITKEPMEVGPTTHYAMGGIRVDADTQMSTVPGLFAAGECAAGLHGANRLGGNSLSDLLVFGERAGRHAAAFVAEQPTASVDAGALETDVFPDSRAVKPLEGLFVA